ncbi:hypothetical protein [Vibrio crassostreae]|jgi:hypothetical protein|uniref:hypothetical protein n=1 Tax=Vibrio crassostreae TaxID=246167 RepID=UPI00063A564A|nr:hypothetical protein [Vibrio crassostreae]CDT76523.1 exported hypothetical protein [Vibrio crassostreae]
MNPKTRILTMATLCVLSLLGGWVGRQFYAETGLVIGSLGTFTLLALALIAAGKVKLSR